MAKTEDTIKLERMIRRYTQNTGSTFQCDEVTIGIGGRERVDFITLDTKKIVRCYEIKVSKADFYSKAANTFIGQYNYYVMTMELYEKVHEDIPDHIGVIASGWCCKNPKKQPLAVNIGVVLMSMVRSLYRDAEKVRETKDVRVIQNLRNRVAQLERQEAKDRKNDKQEMNRLRRFLGREKFLEYMDFEDE